MKAPGTEACLIVNRKHHSSVCSAKQKEMKNQTKVKQTVAHWYSNIYASARHSFHVLKDQENMMRDCDCFDAGM